MSASAFSNLLSAPQTVFSMTFFNWNPQQDDGNNGKPVVSGYLWIYIVLTALFTLTTLVFGGTSWFSGGTMHAAEIC